MCCPAAPSSLIESLHLLNCRISPQAARVSKVDRHPSFLHESVSHTDQVDDSDGAYLDREMRRGPCPWTPLAQTCDPQAMEACRPIFSQADLIGRGEDGGFPSRRRGCPRRLVAVCVHLVEHPRPHVNGSSSEQRCHRASMLPYRRARHAPSGEPLSPRPVCQKGAPGH